MVTGYEQGYYNDISRICGYLQDICSELKSIRIIMENKEK